MTARHKKKQRRHEAGPKAAAAASQSSEQPPAPPAKPPAPEAGAPPEDAAAWKDRALRAQAEMANMRRRLDQDVEERTRMRLEALFVDLITLQDHLGFALEALPEGLADSEETRPFVQGVQAIHASLEAILERHGLEKIHPEEHQAFDSEHHEAVRIEDRPGLEGPRLELVRRGYRMGRRILRPAQVVLQRPPETEEPPKGPGPDPEDGAA